MKKARKEKESYVETVNNGRIQIMEDIAEIQRWQGEDGNEGKELQDNENYRDPLAVDTTIVKHIQLSTGGPGDGFKLYFARCGDNGKYAYELSHGVYYREDWGEYKESSLSDKETQTVFDFYLGGYIEETGE